MPSTAGNMRQSCLERFNEEPETLIPKLIQQHKTPYLVAVQLGVYANAVRVWLVRNGYRCVSREWVRDAEAEHA